MTFISRPDGNISLRHVALRARALNACERFYTHIIGMRVEWRPDADARHGWRKCGIRKRAILGARPSPRSHRRKRRSSFSANVYLTSGHDNLALHRVMADPGPDDRQRLDHIGFIVQRSEQVNDWFTFLTANDVPIVNPPRTHRDGARSLYCRDPDGDVVQMIYHPGLSEC